MTFSFLMKIEVNLYPQKERKPPAKPASLKELAILIGILGGLLARKEDGETGAKTRLVGQDQQIEDQHLCEHMT